MRPHLSILTRTPVAATARTWMSLVSSLRQLMAIDARTYRPERHYMRGPGPKLREKHANVPQLGPRSF